MIGASFDSRMRFLQELITGANGCDARPVEWIAEGPLEGEDAL